MINIEFTNLLNNLLKISYRCKIIYNRCLTIYKNKYMKKLIQIAY
jgi:hypothetical protein